MEKFKESINAIRASKYPVSLKVSLIDGLLSEIKSYRDYPKSPEALIVSSASLKNNELLETCTSQGTLPHLPSEEDLWNSIDQLESEILKNRETKAALEEEIESSICDIDGIEELIKWKRQFNEQLSLKIGEARHRLEEIEEKKQMISTSTKSTKSLSRVLKQSLRSVFS